MANIENRSGGFTLVEMLLATVVSSVILGAIYTSYSIVSRQFEKMSAYAEVQEMGLPVTRFVSRDLRMAGHKAVDSNIESNFGMIENPLVVTDSGGACCDTLEIIYDLDLATRIRTTYYVAQRNNPVRNALYLDKAQWSGLVWDTTVSESLVADYIEDFQIETSNFNNNGDPTLVDLSMIFRSKQPLVREPVVYNKPSYNIGNYDFTATDSYHRDEFNMTINVRNLRDVIY